MKKAGTLVALALSAWMSTAVVPVAAHACANEDRSADHLRAAQVERALRCVVSAERRRRGLRALRPNRRLRLAAGRHARDMVARRYFGHRSRDGSHVLQRVARTGYLRRCMPCRVGETLAWGAGARSRPAAIVRGWLASPPHRRVLLSPAFRQVGIGLARGAPQSRSPSAITAALVAGGRT